MKTVVICYQCGKREFIDAQCPNDIIEQTGYTLLTDEGWICPECNSALLSNAQHPSRQKAIRILEAIAEYMGDEEMFDCKDGSTTWFDLEDKLTNIIEGGNE